MSPCPCGQHNLEFQTPSPLQETGLRRGLGVYREPLWEGLAREATGREGEEGALRVWMRRPALSSAQ
ncbi:hypothetical protein CapIbe_015667 [Capra ibex]